MKWGDKAPRMCNLKWEFFQTFQTEYCNLCLCVKICRSLEPDSWLSFSNRSAPSLWTLGFLLENRLLGCAEWWHICAALCSEQHHPIRQLCSCIHRSWSLGWETLPSSYLGLWLSDFIFPPCVWEGVDTGAQPLILDKVAAFCIVLCYVSLLRFSEALFLSHPPSCHINIKNVWSIKNIKSIKM